MAVTQVTNLNDILVALNAPKGTTILLTTGSLQMLAISDQPLAHFPQQNFKPFLVMSSGIANKVTDANTSQSQAKVARSLTTRAKAACCPSGA